MAHHHSLSLSSSSSSIFDPLYCEEEEDQWEEEEEEETHQTPSLLPILLLKNDLFLEDEELVSLLSKEEMIDVNVHGSGCFSLARREAVKWMLKVNSHYGFSTHTATLSVNYLDRFFSKSTHLHHQDKPWMAHLAAVTCLSLAAKFEETDVPVLLDLQVEGTEYVFEAKTIQKMELLVLSTLDWKMNPVTPVSFLDHITRRLGLKNHIEWEFVRRCEQLLLSVASDSRFVGYLPSVVATATMMHVIDQIQPCNPLDFQNRLLGALNITKESVKHCYDMIVAVSKNGSQMNPTSPGNKREREPSHEAPSSPKGVLDSYYLSSDSSNESWALTEGNSSTSPSVSSSPDKHASKKQRVGEQPLRVLAGAVGIALGIISYIVTSLMRHFITEEFQAFFLIFPLHLWKRY